MPVLTKMADGWEVALGTRSFLGQTGVVLHQPLNLSIFRKKSKNGQNMNGIPVCRSRKTENAPTWRSPRPLFWGSFLAYFTGISAAPNLSATHQPTTKL